MIPSFLRILRQPRHQRFHIEPRYYDPVKEYIEKRTEKAKRDYNSEEIESTYESRLRFNRKLSQSKPKSRLYGYGSLIQLGLALYLGGLVVGWLEFGNVIFHYFGWISIALYLIYRLRNILKNR